MGEYSLDESNNDIPEVVAGAATASTLEEAFPL